MLRFEISQSPDPPSAHNGCRGAGDLQSFGCTLNEKCIKYCH